VKPWGSPSPNRTEA